MIPLTFRQLEVFVQVVEAGSFRLCADQMSVSQVSIGEHVKALERQLGCELFHRRRGSAAVLTAAGEQVYRRARDILGLTVDMLAAFETSPRERARRKLRIGAHGYIAESLSKRLATFVSAHPDVNIELQRRSFRDILGGMNNSEIELGYFLSLGPVPEAESALAWREEIALFVGAEHPLSGCSSVDPQDLVQFPFIYLPVRAHLRSQVDSVMAGLGIVGCPVALTSDDHYLILENLSNGRSFACMFTRPMEQLVESGRLKQLPLTRPLPDLEVRYLVRAPYQHDRTMALLINSLARDAPLSGV